MHLKHFIHLVVLPIVYFLSTLEMFPAMVYSKYSFNLEEAYLGFIHLDKFVRIFDDFLQCLKEISRLKTYILNELNLTIN